MILSITDHTGFILTIGFGTLILAALIIYLIYKVRKYNKFIQNIKPSRFLNEQDLKAIQFLEMDGNLSVIPIVKELPKSKKFKSVYQFSNCSFQITQTRRAKAFIHSFSISINNTVIEVIVPDIFLAYLNEGEFYKNKTIEILFRTDHFVLFNIEYLIGYNSLYEKFKLEQKTTDATLQRIATKEEIEAFSISKWGSIWALMTPIFIPFLILGVLNEGILMSFVFLPILAPIGYLTYKGYKKRETYINSRMVHFLKGTIWFDEEKYVYRINQDELKLHRKWKQIITTKKLPIENIEMEALLHTYDNLDLKVCKKFQPVAIKGNMLNLKEANIKSTRSWGVVFLYWAAFSIIVGNAPNYAYKRHLIVNPLDLFTITEDYYFALTMTLIWWASIILTLHLTYLLISRIRGHYFKNNI